MYCAQKGDSFRISYLIPSGSENKGEKMVEEMIQAETGSMIATSVVVLELHEVAQIRGESKEMSPDGEMGKYSFLFCVHYTNNFTVFPGVTYRVHTN